MTLRLSAFFETHIKTVLNNWKATMRRAAKSRRNGRTSSSISPNKRRNQRNRASTTRRKTKKNKRQLNSSEDDDGDSTCRSLPLGIDDDEDDDDDDDDDLDNPRPSGSQAVRRSGQLKRSVRANTTSQNRVTSSSSTQPQAYAINELDGGGNVRSRRSNRQKTGLNNSTESEEEEELEDDDEEDSDESSASSTKSSASEQSEKKDLRRAQRSSRRNHVLDEEEEDSEESYKPTRRSKNKLQRFSKQKHKDEDYVQTKRKTTTKTNLTNGRAGSLSQQDESTQEAETPLKRSRVAKTTNTASNVYDGPSTSASALLRMRQEQQHVDPNNSRTRTRQIVVENNDHSYHLPVRNGRLIDSDSDSHEAVVRPTRASVKRAVLNWARSSDVEAADEELEVPQNEASDAEEVSIKVVNCCELRNTYFCMQPPRIEQWQ